MRAFIIRPFGTKSGIDFENVERTLIDPALARLDVSGRTTAAVIEAGNIREDMFQLLLLADLVIADISIHNANAFYELGIRHALRERATFLIRATGVESEVPFDLRTDRYLPYNPAAPGDALDALTAGLKATLASERQDSPVFLLLPELREQERSRFLPLPREFREEVEYAAKSRLPGKLALLGNEAAGSVWESEGLRLVGREQFRCKDFQGAAVTLELLRNLAPLDQEANLLLGTIYQRLGDLPKSEQALRRVLGSAETPPKDRAEAFALLGRNLKTQWSDAWRKRPVDGRRVHALQSPLLMQSFDAYLKGFRQDLNHFYSGLNALAMLTILLDLANRLPEAWADGFDSDEEAARTRVDLETQCRLLAGAVEFSIESSRQYLQQTGKSDPWVEISVADFKFLTADRVGSVTRAYQAALTDQPAFLSDSVRTQLELYQALDVLSEKTTRVLEILSPSAVSESSLSAPAARRTIVFTGHAIDAPGRAVPRFPPDKEGVARAEIRAAVLREIEHGAATGVAGAASGGDILFHEVCAELGLPTRLLLALPPEAYVNQSVAPAGPEWVHRFWTIYERHPSSPVLSRSKEVPGWLHHRRDYSIWQRNNLWTLYEAFASGGADKVTVLALWDGKEGDGPGGTADMIRIASARGAETRVLDTRALFGAAAAEK